MKTLKFKGVMKRSKDSKDLVRKEVIKVEGISKNWIFSRFIFMTCFFYDGLFCSFLVHFLFT